MLIERKYTLTFLEFYLHRNYAGDVDSLQEYYQNANI